MVKKEIVSILEESKQWGWVLEPDALRISVLAGLDVPRFTVARVKEDVRPAGGEIGYPLVAKVVSPAILHKSDVRGVEVGIGDGDELEKAFARFSSMDAFREMIIEEMISGMELIVGAKNDYQFGPMIMLGIGGTGVEIYRDVSIRMAPLDEKDMDSMIRGLRARRLLEGYRGREPIDMDRLKGMLHSFSTLVLKLEQYVESIDLNPVMCTSERCVVADARIILKKADD